MQAAITASVINSRDTDQGFIALRLVAWRVGWHAPNQSQPSTYPADAIRAIANTYRGDRAAPVSDRPCAPSTSWYGCVMYDRSLALEADRSTYVVPAHHRALKVTSAVLSQSDGDTHTADRRPVSVRWRSRSRDRNARDERHHCLCVMSVGRADDTMAETRAIPTPFCISTFRWNGSSILWVGYPYIWLNTDRARVNPRCSAQD